MFQVKSLHRLNEKTHPFNFFVQISAHRHVPEYFILNARVHWRSLQNFPGSRKHDEFKKKRCALLFPLLNVDIGYGIRWALLFPTFFALSNILKQGHKLHSLPV